jgi:hypothetical protein
MEQYRDCQGTGTAEPAGNDNSNAVGLVGEVGESKKDQRSREISGNTG